MGEPHRPRGSDFYQQAPRLGNQYEDDRLLRSYLRWRLPPELLAELAPSFSRVGGLAATEWLALGNAAEAAPPRHVPYDPWGRRVDRIDVPEAWRALERIAAEEGLVAIGYERAHGAWSRLDQLTRLFLFAPSSATYSCPLAMSDGAARILETQGDDDPRLRAAFEHLTTRDPARVWTSGQWMTERTGGSDVSGTSTVARMEEGQWRLYGTKWFTSATTSQMAMTLARVEGGADGTRALGLFYLELRDADGKLRGMRIHRLKDKLGTRALPTAELALVGTPAQLIGAPGEGVRRIATLLNITRLYNALASVAGMRRASALARDYATRRVAFGRPIAEQPAHLETLAEMELEGAAGLHLVFHLVELLGREECGTATADELALLRLLTPVAKLYTAKQAIAVASEALESFGGAGYIEDTGLPQLLRDAQVLSIWEGTTNVLSLDVLRVLGRGEAIAVFLRVVRARADGVRAQALEPAAERLRAAAARLGEHLAEGRGPEEQQAGARALAYTLARSYAASLLLEHADWALAHGDGEAEAAAALRWCARDLAPLRDPDEAQRAASRLLVYGSTQA